MAETEPSTRPSLRERFAALSTARDASVDRWLLIAGAILGPLGLVVIFLGYTGASHTPFVFEQIPYVISGGLLGVALVFLGGFIYFTYWQTRTVREARDHQREVLDKLEHIAVLLAGDVPAAAAGSGRLVATAAGAMFHREDCPVAQRAEKLKTVRGTERGLRPCGICNPVSA
jgi:hypothetical protein